MKVIGNTEKDSDALHISKVFHKKSNNMDYSQVEEKTEDKESNSLKIPIMSKKEDFDIEKVGSMKVMGDLAKNDEKSMKIPGLRHHGKRNEDAEEKAVKGLKVMDKQVDKADKSLHIAKVAHEKPKSSGKVLPTLDVFDHLGNFVELFE